MKQTQDQTTTWLAKVNLVNDRTARDHTHTTLSTALPSGPASGGPSELIDRPEHNTCAVTHARTAACHTRPNAWPFKGQAVASRPRTGTSCCCCGPAVAAAHELLLPSLCCLPSSTPVSVRTCRCPHLSERRTSTRMSQPPPSVHLRRPVDSGPRQAPVYSLTIGIAPIRCLRPMAGEA